MSGLFSPQELLEYRRDGFVLVGGLFAEDEVARLIEHARHDAALDQSAYDRLDGSGGRTRLALWNIEGNDLYSMFSRSARIVDRVEQLLEGEAYHWHAKMMLKEPRVGGAWEWHQDYGYWYHNGCLFPLLCSVMIALDPSTRANGCLEVLRGSQQMGRIDHMKIGDQTGADPERVAAACTRLELLSVEMQPGDALFFDANLLHRSAQNRSEQSRWSLICCYNARRNDPYCESRHPAYHPLSKVGDEAIRSWRDES